MRVAGNTHSHGPTERGSVLIIVLWVALGLVTITLYFANSMTFELRASDNRVSGVSAEQAIEGGARYVTYVLQYLATNGTVPYYLDYQREAVPVGDAHFWLIGRDHDNLVPPNQVFFGLVDEGSKLNLNTVGTNMLTYLPRITPQFMGALIDWRDSDNDITENGAESQSYTMLRPPYQCKNTNYETTEELRLVLGATMDILVGEDVNRNGVLDVDEYDDNRNNFADPGILEYVTAYTREPNTGRTNLNNQQQMAMLLQDRFGTSRANEMLAGLTGGGGAGGGGRGGGGGATTTFRSPLEFYRKSGMKLEEFEQIAKLVTVASGSSITGRVNVSTASGTVLSCLPGMTPDLALQLVNYRQSNPNQLTSLAWVVEALGQNNATILDALQAGDYITTESYQFTAGIAGLGPYGRGYRRVRFVFDTSEGTPRVLYRQDLSHLGWALGREVRQVWLSPNNSREPKLISSSR